MQNHTLKFYIRKDKANKHGLLPVYLRVTINRKVKPASTSYYIHPKQWDEKNEVVINHPLADQMNLDLLNRKKAIMDKLVNEKVAGRVISSKGVFEKVKYADIFTFFDQYADDMKHKRDPETIEVWRKHMRKLEQFNGSRELAFDAIDVSYLEQFDKYLATVGVRKRKDTSNYRYAILKTIRGLFYAAKRKYLTENYPFKDFEMPKVTAGDKDYLTMEELEKWMSGIEALPLHMRSVASWFAFGCTTGLRVSDWLVFDFSKRLQKNMVLLRPEKNKKRGNNWVTIPLYTRLNKAIELCRRYPLDEGEKSINRKLKDIAGLLGVPKDLSTHCGRRTFAVTICLEHGISSETAARMMGITLAVFDRNYAAVSVDKVKLETEKAWAGL